MKQPLQSVLLFRLSLHLSLQNRSQSILNLGIQSASYFRFLFDKNMRYLERQRSPDNLLSVAAVTFGILVLPHV